MANCLERVGVRENMSSTLPRCRFNTPEYTLAYAMFSVNPRRHKKTRMYALRTLRNSMHLPRFLVKPGPRKNHHGKTSHNVGTQRLQRSNSRLKVLQAHV